MATDEQLEAKYRLAEQARAKAATGLLGAAGTLALPAAEIGIDIPAAIETLAAIGAKALPILGGVFMQGDTDVEDIDKDIAFKEGRGSHPNRFAGDRGNKPSPKPKPPIIPPSAFPVAAAAASQKERIQQAVEPIIESAAPAIEQTIADTRLPYERPIVEAVQNITPRLSSELLHAHKEAMLDNKLQPIIQTVTNDSKIADKLKGVNDAIRYAMNYSGEREIARVKNLAIDFLNQHGFDIARRTHVYDVKNILNRLMDHTINKGR